MLSTPLCGVQVPSYPSLLVDEVLHPFYLFQLCSILLWSLDEYVFYAACIGLISLVSVLVSLLETRRQAEALHELVEGAAAGSVEVERAGQRVSIPAAHLAPGDLLLVPPAGCLLACDAVLTTGSAIVNESLLTGESVPVSKCAVPGEMTGELWCPDTHRRHTLFAGTQVVQTRYYGGQLVKAVVVSTGFNTSRGELVRSILFPRPVNFKFYRDSVRFIGVLFCIAALGMVTTVIYC